MSTRRSTGTVTLVLCLALAGCGGGSIGVTLRAAENLPLCDGVGGDLPLRVEVRELEQYSECNLEGSLLVFPTGEEIEIPAPGGTGGQESSNMPHKVSWTNWGPDGVAATLHEPHGETSWGTPTGLLQQYRSLLNDAKVCQEMGLPPAC